MTRQEIARFLGFAALGGLAVLILRLSLLPDAERAADKAGSRAMPAEHEHAAPKTGSGAEAAEHAHAAPKADAPGVEPLSPAPDLVLKNTTCPIMGGKALATERMLIEGIEVHLCCPACEASIREDPRAAFKLLLEDPGSAAALRAHLLEHPEKARALGVADLLRDGR